jgi:hypothetical protein
VVLLALVFLLDGIKQFRVNLGERVIFCKHEKTPIDKRTRQRSALNRREPKDMRGSRDTNAYQSVAAQANGKFEISRSPVGAHLRHAPAGRSLS